MQKPIKEKDLEISFIQKINKFLSPGELISNEFNITLHNCKSIEHLEKIIDELKSKGLPNYFGLQRFGSSRNNASFAASLPVFISRQDYFYGRGQAGHGDKERDDE